MTLPRSTGSYVRITTGTATQLGTDLAQQVKTSSGALWTKPLVGIYGNASSTAPAAVFIGGDGASNPRLRTQLARSSPGLFIDGFMMEQPYTNNPNYSGGLSFRVVSEKALNDDIVSADIATVTSGR